MLLSLLMWPVMVITVVIAKHTTNALPEVNTGFSWPAVVYAFWEPLIAWGIIAGLLVWFRESGNGPSRIWEFCSALAYAVYIVHAPVLVATALVLRRWSGPAPEKIAVTGALACLLSLGGGKCVAAGAGGSTGAVAIRVSRRNTSHLISRQLSPRPTSATIGTENSATSSISRFTNSCISSASAGTTSKSSSSWTCRVILERRRRCSIFRSSAIIASLIRSAAVPCSGVLTAVRSAKPRMLGLRERMSGMGRMRPK